MKVVVLLALCCFHQTSGGQHFLQYFYTASKGIVDLPQFIAVGMVDGKQIDWYDSNTKMNMLKQTWMEGARDESSITQIRQGQEAAFLNNIQVAMSRFNQTSGVHVFQEMYGCEWDDATGVTKGFEQDGYDGEDMISLDLENNRWIAAVPQALSSKQKWDNDKAKVESVKQYYNQICIDWLKKYVQYGSSTLGRKVPPKVSLLQKDTSLSEVLCHATGFYPEGVMITWRRDGVEIQDDVNVGETLPNHDGTFQKIAVLTVSPEERKKGQYTCEVAHTSGEPIILILKEDNNLPIIIAVCAIVAVVLVIVIVTIVIKKRKDLYAKAPQSDTSSENSGTPK